MNRNKTTALGSSQPPGRDVGRDRIMCSQINLHHCQAATLGCGQRLVGPNQWTRQDLERIDIAMVQEPYLNNGQVKIFHNNINILQNHFVPLFRSEKIISLPEFKDKSQFKKKK